MEVSPFIDNHGMKEWDWRTENWDENVQYPKWQSTLGRDRFVVEHWPVNGRLQR